MSRGKRSKHRADADRATADAPRQHDANEPREHDADKPREPDADDRPVPRSRRLLVDLALMLGAFVVVSLVAELAGAPNLGTALSFGQIAFMLAAVYVLVRR